jgi:SAM-dependent methyltransferase
MGSLTVSLLLIQQMGALRGVSRRMTESKGTRMEHDPATYGDRMAEVYDEWFAVPRNEEDAASFLSELAGPGPALELGIGTGRVALPLARRGVEVHGIDASRAMLKKLREKPGGEQITVSVGDLADVGVEGEFRLVYVAFNTFFALLAQEDQVRCFVNVARHLGRRGTFVVEAFVPDIGLFERGQRIATADVGPGHVVLEASKHDPVDQRVTANQVVISEEGIRIYPVRIRYAWPSELDLMARLAELRLRERWGGWRREPFTAASAGHVSVYEQGGTG